MCSLFKYSRQVNFVTHKSTSKNILSYTRKINKLFYLSTVNEINVLCDITAVLQLKKYNYKIINRHTSSGKNGASTDRDMFDVRSTSARARSNNFCRLEEFHSENGATVLTSGGNDAFWSNALYENESFWSSETVLPSDGGVTESVCC